MRIYKNSKQKDKIIMKYIFVKLISGFLMSLFLLFPVVIFAQTTPAGGTTSGANSALGINSAIAGLEETAEAGKLIEGKNKNQKGLLDVVSGAIKILLGFVGVIFMVLIVYGGLIWMTAGGDDQKVKQSIDIMKNATLGLVAILAAYALTIFVIRTIISAL